MQKQILRQTKKVNLVSVKFNTKACGAFKGAGPVAFATLVNPALFSRCTTYNYRVLKSS